MSNLSMYSNGHTHLEVITVHTSGIMESLDFRTYYWLIFISNTCMLPVDLRIWIVVTHQVRQLMPYRVFLEVSIPTSFMRVKQIFYLE